MGLSAQFHYGIKWGVNVSNIDASAKEYPGVRCINVGVFGEYGLPLSVGMRSGVFYSEKGSNYVAGTASSITRPTHIEDLDLKFLEVPLQVLYKVHVDGDMDILLSAGGYLARLVKGNAFISYFDGGCAWNTLENMEIARTVEQVSYVTYIPQFSKWDNGFLLSVDAVYKRVAIGIGYQHGKKVINKVLSNCHNRTFTISVGYYFK